jgi:RNA polymerase sigma-70 factor (ECF subfamily)
MGLPSKFVDFGIFRVLNYMGALSTSRDEAALLSRWRQGDPAAFESLVRRWEQPVARFLARFTGGADSVADLCQEVFLRVYQARERYRETGAFSPWLYRIALNVARDAGRRRQRQPLQLLDESHAAAHFAANDDSRDELAQAVTRAVADLPPHLREVLVLRHYEGMRFEAISRTTGIPATTLKSRFVAALHRLRVALRSFDDDSEEMKP